MKIPRLNLESFRSSMAKINKPDSDVDIHKTGIPALDSAEKVNRLITTDELTGVGNRNYLKNLTEEISNANNNKPFAVIYFDIDNFKTINNTLGHTEGDRVLKEFAEFLKSTFRTSDHIIRSSEQGDEFIVFCQNRDETDGFKEAINKRLIQLRNRELENIEPPADYSFGLDYFYPSEKSVKSAMETADQLMYQDKSSRKQR